MGWLLRFSFRLWPGVVSDFCTPENCPDGPIVVGFQYPNCTGPISFFSFDESPNWFQCVPSFYNGSDMSIYNDDYIEDIRYVDPDCGGGLHYPALKGTRYYFGRCTNNLGDVDFGKSKSLHYGITSAPLKTAGFSYMYLRNANQHFEAPQYPVVNPNEPESYLETLECFNPCHGMDAS